MSRLASYVHVEGPDGSAAFGPDDDLPEWAARKMGAHCFEDGVHPYAAADADAAGADGDTGEGDGAEGGPPPKAGPNATKDAWLAYADEHQVDVSGCGTRDEIIAALAAADVPTE